MQHIYGLFGFEFRLELSTRPEKYLGAIETWNAAEEVSLLLYYPSKFLIIWSIQLYTYTEPGYHIYPPKYLSSL